jgi:hypothetical protein
MDNVRRLLQIERQNALRLHGNLTQDPIRCSAILTEELGEVTREALALTRPEGGLRETREKMRREIAQLVSVGILWLENLEDEDNQFQEGNIR